MKNINFKCQMINFKKKSGQLVEVGMLVFSLIMLITPIVCFSSETIEKDIVFRALQDEMQRSIAELQLENQAKPYYIAYRVKDINEIEIKASFGGLLSSDESKRRELFVDLRVGDYKLDNSNFICQTSGSRVIEAERVDLPIEDEYFALRQAIWLVTDGTYKKALERIARKKAYYQNKQAIDTIPDFTKTAPCSLIEPIASIKYDINQLNEKVVRLSGIFKGHSSIFESNVRLILRYANQYFLDSDGAKNVRQEYIAGIEVKAKVQAKTGEIIEDFTGFYGQGLEDLDFVAIEKSINAWTETLMMKVDAKNEEEGYSGPVLFLGQASCELFLQILGKGVSGVRQPVIESEMLERNIPRANFGVFANRLNKRILPDFISVYDDPGLRERSGVPLIGGFSIDEQGVKSERVELVRDGKLINFLMSRTPVNKIRETNGHARYYDETYCSRYIGFVSNLMISSKQRLSEIELAEKLKTLAKDYGNDYAIIITNLETTPPQNSMERYRRIYQARTKQTPLLSSPVNMYKFDINTGSLELITGLEFSQVSPGILKDIVATGEKEYIYNSVYRSDYGDEYPVSIVAPAVLIEEMELVQKKIEKEKPPIVSRP
ncbi:MAG: metallopeptidase TldD-related protein [candidate division WOR-3 bacterium]